LGILKAFAILALRSKAVLSEKGRLWIIAFVKAIGDEEKSFNWEFLRHLPLIWFFELLSDDADFFSPLD